MSLFPKGSFDGNYLPRGNLADADCVIGHEFGYRKENGEYGSVNEELGFFVVHNCVRLPLILNHNIAAVVEEAAPELRPLHILGGQSTDLLATKGTGSWGELAEAKVVMQENGLKHPALVAQAFHVPRVAKQARRQGMEAIVPLGLPAIFDPGSAQSWTRDAESWKKREVFAPLEPLARYINTLRS